MADVIVTLAWIFRQIKISDIKFWRATPIPITKHQHRHRISTTSHHPIASLHRCSLDDAMVLNTVGLLNQYYYEMISIGGKCGGTTRNLVRIGNRQTI
jgi:hypothetical protein